MNSHPASAVSRIHRLSVITALFFGSLACSAAAFAAQPLITDDAGTMGSGKAQLELTGQYGHDRENGGTSTETEGAATLTYGLTDAVDLVLGLPYQHLKNEEADTTTESGISDASLDVKWRFYEQDGFSLAVKPGITLPTGDDEKGLGSGKATYKLFFISSKEIAPWAFHLNLGYIRNENTQGDEKNLWHASFAATVAMAEHLTAVANIGVERNPDRLADSEPAFLLGGLIYTLSEGLDLDCGIKYGLTDSETDYTVLAGVTWKF